MKIQQLALSHGQIIGGTLPNKSGQIKLVPLAAIKDLTAAGKIDNARIIDNTLYFDEDLYKNTVSHAKVNIAKELYNEDGKLTGYLLDDDREISLVQAWDLAADDRINGLKAVYDTRISQKLVVNS